MVVKIIKYGMYFLQVNIHNLRKIKMQNLQNIEVKKKQTEYFFTISIIGYQLQNPVPTLACTFDFINVYLTIPISVLN